MIPQGRSGTEVETWRERILDVAEEHFRRIGYEKTSVADIASCLGMSSANIYRFFPSRAAINQCICDRFVGQTIQLAAAVARRDAPARDKLTRLFNLLFEERRRQLIEEKYVHDLVVAATIENWPIMSIHGSRLVTMVQKIIEEGTEAGDLSVNDAVEAARSAMNAFLSFYHPVLVEARLRDAEAAKQGPDQQISFILSALDGYRAS
ncbi:TetR family transcriptional regulator [Rhizobium azibense]|nr:TetR family transcriptional regulator [Rhizobium azibense]